MSHQKKCIWVITHQARGGGRGRLLNLLIKNPLDVAINKPLLPEPQAQLSC